MTENVLYVDVLVFVGRMEDSQPIKLIIENPLGWVALKKRL
jgi:hypothetical protein